MHYLTILKTAGITIGIIAFVIYTLWFLIIGYWDYPVN